MAEGTLHTARRSLSANDEMQAQGAAHSHNSELADVAIRARDGATLNAWSIRPRNSNGRVVILLHGLGDNRLGMIGYAELFLGHGFSVLMPDARAHGTSGGQLSTYGLLESEDIHRWFDWLQQNQHPGCIFGLGSPWAQPRSCNHCTPNPASVQLQRNRPFRVFERLPMIASDSSSRLVRGSDGLSCVRS